MKRNLLRPLLVPAVLAAVSGCASQEGYQLPDYRSGGGGYGPAYPPYVSGYYGYGRGPVYAYGYPGGYDPFYYAPGMPGPYPYGYSHGPYPRVVVVPCVDANHDGRCDRNPGKPDNGPRNDWPDRGDHGHGDGDHGGGHHQRNGSVAPPPLPQVQPGAQPPVVQPKQSPTGGAAPTQPDPRPRHHQAGRDDDTPRQPRN